MKNIKIYIKNVFLIFLDRFLFNNKYYFNIFSSKKYFKIKYLPHL